MIKKILCVFHKEDTPSLVLYPDGYRCFGCGAFGALSELEDVDLPPVEELKKPDPENLTESFKYIDSLPKKNIRGLELPFDTYGYYISWPDKNYYKKRLFQVHEDRAKYYGASGHSKPLFWANNSGNPTLAIVEGEINALSVAKAMPNTDVCSPGGVGDFSEKRSRQLLTVYYKYSTILVIADADPPGAEGIINTLAVLWSSKLKAVGVPMKPDANEILVESGEAGLRNYITKYLG